MLTPIDRSVRFACFSNRNRIPSTGVQTVEIAEAAEGDQQSTGPETSRADAALVAKTYRQHRVDLLHVFHHFRHFRCSSEYTAVCAVNFILEYSISDIIVSA